MTSGTPDSIVVNTSPLIAIMVGCGNWEVLERIDAHIVVPRVVVEELRSGPNGAPGRDDLLPANVEIADSVDVPVNLGILLDIGEASVIAIALKRGSCTVCIDELAGRRVARVSGLHVTGSLGLLVRAHQLGYSVDFPRVLKRMRTGGVWYSDKVLDEVTRIAGA